MSLAGKAPRKAFWGTLGPVAVSIVLVAVSTCLGAYNSLHPLGTPFYSDLRFYWPIAAASAAALVTGLDRYYSAKKAKTGATVVAQGAFDVLKGLESAMGWLTTDDKFQSYFDDLVKQCGPKFFRERNVRIGFFVLEAGEDEEQAALVYLKKRTAHEPDNGMPLMYRAGNVDADQRDQAQEMIARTESSKDLLVKNIYKDGPNWTRLVKVKKHSYRCFISAPVLDNKREKPLGLLTVDAPKVGDLTPEDQKWVRVLAGMLSHGLRDETADEPRLKNPLNQPGIQVF